MNRNQNRKAPSSPHSPLVPGFQPAPRPVLGRYTLQSKCESKIQLKSKGMALAAFAVGARFLTGTPPRPKS